MVHERRETDNRTRGRGLGRIIQLVGRYGKIRSPKGQMAYIRRHRPTALPCARKEVFRNRFNSRFLLAGERRILVYFMDFAYMGFARDKPYCQTDI